MLVDENEDSYIVLVNEKLMSQKLEILEYLQFIKENRTDKIRNQNIKIIWVKDNQKLFTYNLEVNIDKGNLVDLDIVNVLTLANGDYTDYDRIIGYQGNPFKIYIEDGLNKNEYLIMKTANLGVAKHIQEIYSLYDIVNAEIESSKDIILQQILGMILLIFCIILSICQNIYIFIKNESRGIFVKMIHGHSFINKFYRYYIYQAISWGLLIMSFSLLGSIENFEIFNKKYILISTYYFLIIEYLISYICFCKIEKKNIARLLKGGE